MDSVSKSGQISIMLLPWKHTCECNALIWLLNVTVRLFDVDGTKLGTRPLLFWFMSYTDLMGRLHTSIACTFCFTLKCKYKYISIKHNYIMVLITSWSD